MKSLTETNCYMIKHIPTGLYFRPHKNNKPSLHRIGEIYWSKPTSVLTYYSQEGYYWGTDNKRQKFVLDDWQIVKFRLVEA